MNRPLLSVCLITYNHANYIKKAIESILMQKTSFDFEIIIADDCSSDGTTEIVKKYAEKYPKTIHTIIQEKNIGPAKNYLILLRAATAKYIAYLEGDDYWTDDTKLEQQISFLEANIDYSLCFHSIYTLFNGKLKKSSIVDIPDTSDINYLLSHPGYISSLSVVYRNSSQLVTLLEKMIDSPFGDFITYIAVTQQGLIKFIPKRMGVYRKHSAGTWSALGYKEIFLRTLIAYKMLFAQLSKEQGDMLKIRYLIALEAYFLQENLEYDEKEFNKLLITEMNIDTYVIKYIKQNCEERKKVFHYSSRIPVRILLKSLQHKLLNRFC